MVAGVIVGLNNPAMDRVFDYIVPEGMTVKSGTRVIVPFGKRNTRTEGCVLSLAEETDVPTEKMKAILEVLDEGKPAFTPPLLALAKWMQERYFCTLNQCLQVMLPPGLHHSEYKKEKRLFSLAQGHPLTETVWKKTEMDKRLAGQRLILDYLQGGREATAAELKEALGITDSPIRTLLKKGILQERRQEERRAVFDAELFEKTTAFVPTEEQGTVLAALRTELQREEKRPVLLHGVTGSGKTEIYMQLIADVVARGQQAIVLVPEIALTPLILERFISRFGDAVSVTHSRLSMGERADQWKKARDGEISIVVGTRSALFLPFADVGVIIMDEAHENSYVSDITPKYDTKDVAAALAKAYGCLFLMGTATPDLVSYHRAKRGEYLLLELRERTGGGVLPQVFVTDMRKELAEGNRSPFSRALQTAIRENLQKGEQTMLFLNRRGYATFVSCRSCGHGMTCPDCEITYTYHAQENALVCHYCGRRAAVPQVCPICGSKYIRYFGTGTQKIEEEARRLFPNARILRMDLDTTMTKHSHTELLETFGRGEADILIGTQMIAKGHDFPNVTLVGIMAADLSLNIDSYLASETAFRLMIQAAGRAGRRDGRGRVLLQTYQPEHYAVQYAAKQDFQGFYAEEIAIRELMGYPPFSSVFSIVFSGEEQMAAEAAAQQFAQRLMQADTEGLAVLLGPVALPKFRGEYRQRILVKATEEEPLRKLVLPVAEQMKKERKDNVRIQLLLNPTNLL